MIIIVGPIPVVMTKPATKTLAITRVLELLAVILLRLI